MGLRDKILAADDLGREPVLVPEWGVTAEDGLCLRPFTHAERAKFETLIAKRTDKDGRLTSADGLVGQMLATCLVDSDGRPVFKPEDVGALEAKNAAVTRRLWARLQGLSGMGEAAAAEAEKN